MRWPGFYALGRVPLGPENEKKKKRNIRFQKKKVNIKQRKKNHKPGPAVF